MEEGTLQGGGRPPLAEASASNQALLEGWGTLVAAASGRPLPAVLSTTPCTFRPWDKVPVTPTPVWPYNPARNEAYQPVSELGERRQSGEILCDMLLA